MSVDSNTHIPQAHTYYSESKSVSNEFRLQTTTLTIGQQLLLYDIRNKQQMKRYLMFMHLIELLSRWYNSDITNACWTTSESPL